QAGAGRRAGAPTRGERLHVSAEVCGAEPESPRDPRPRPFRHRQPVCARGVVVTGGARATVTDRSSKGPSMSAGPWLPLRSILARAAALVGALALLAGPLSAVAVAGTSTDPARIGLYGSQDPTFDGTYRQSLALLALVAS